MRTTAGWTLKALVAVAAAQILGGIAVAQVEPIASSDARQLLAFGTDKGGGGAVHVYGTTPQTQGILIALLLPYQAGFNGGIRVATGDVNGDGIADLVTAPGAGAPGHVKVFNGASLLNGTPSEGLSFFAFEPEFTGGVFVAAGDIDGDGRAEIVASAESGAPHVKVFDGANAQVLQSFMAFDASFRGGVRVAAGDVTGDGAAEIIVAAGAGGGPHVKVFDGASAVQGNFLAYDASFAGGVFVAAGDVNGDGIADIITGAGPGGGPHVKVFGPTGDVLSSFFAFDPKSKAGVKVGVADPHGYRALSCRTVGTAAADPKLIGLLLPSYLIVTTPGSIGRTVRDPLVRFFNVQKSASEAMFGGVAPFGLRFKKALFVTP